MESQKNKQYQKLKNWLALVGIGLTLFVLVTALWAQLTIVFHEWAISLVSQKYAVVFLYFLFFSLYSLLITSGLSFYSGFLVEHKFELSNHTFASWLWDWTKKQLLSFGLMAPLVIGLYALIWNFESTWWFLAWLGYAAFSLILGKLFPVLIVPIFYKYSPITNTALKERISALAKRFGFAIENVFSLNLSKTTKKANAMFSGFGKTRRVVLGDTLLNSFSDDEIETVVGHELGHCKHRDIWKHFGYGVAFSFFGFWIAFEVLKAASGQFGFTGAGDVKAFPLLCLVFFVFQLFLLPVGNAISRRAERQADQFALEATNDAPAFASALQKLSDTNLADPEPHPLIEFLLYDHPAIARRIQMAKQFGAGEKT